MQKGGERPGGGSAVPHGPLCGTAGFLEGSRSTTAANQSEHQRTRAKQGCRWLGHGIEAELEGAGIPEGSGLIDELEIGGVGSAGRIAIEPEDRREIDVAAEMQLIAGIDQT